MLNACCCSRMSERSSSCASRCELLANQERSDNLLSIGSYQLSRLLFCAPVYAQVGSCYTSAHNSRQIATRRCQIARLCHQLAHLAFELLSATANCRLRKQQLAATQHSRRLRIPRSNRWVIYLHDSQVGSDTSQLSVSPIAFIEPVECQEFPGFNPNSFILQVHLIGQMWKQQLPVDLRVG